MTVGEIAALLAAVAACVLVALAALPLLKLNKLIDEARESVREIGKTSVPLLHDLKDTVGATNQQLAKLQAVTDEVGRVSENAAVATENAAQLSTLLKSVLGGPLVKTASVTYGARRAITGRKKLK